MKIIIGFVLIFIGLVLIYLKKNKKILVPKRRDYFYIPPEIRGFWGISIGMILCGIILLLQDLNV